MGQWTYYAGSIASLEDGLDLARRFGVMWRGARNTAGALVAMWVTFDREMSSISYTGRRGALVTSSRQ